MTALRKTLQGADKARDLEKYLSLRSRKQEVSKP